ncbi:MAG: FtsW/RodA/SpoVE family cell cycle protein, partial [Firmicutes bacterium]|nr:FtsW/RodA/SpoVE family cell cycle protein [Bacillota bacterium]
MVSIVIWFLFSDQYFPWWQPLLIWFGFLLIYLITKKKGNSAQALPFAALLTFLGWFFLYRLDPLWAGLQFQGILLGFCCYLGGLFLPWAEGELIYLYAGAGLLLLLATLFFGQWSGGAKAWLALGKLRFQPVEFARVFLILFLAAYFAKIPRGQQRFWAFFLLCAVFLVLALQRDLGPALLLFFVVGSLSLYLSFSWRVLLGYIITGVFGFWICLSSFSHLRSRVAAWLQPWDYLDTKGYQVVQGLFAFQAGGVVGRGIGG